jgi:hypothetical protein
MDETVVAVVSDHGEELFEHRKLGHSHTLFDELLLVPLVIRFPGGRVHGRVPQQVRTMDLFPTLLDAVGLPVPSGLDATTLLPLLHGRGSPPLPAFAEFVSQGPDPGAKALRLPAEKLIVSPASGLRAYFDLAADPGEQRNVAARHDERVRALAVTLEQELLAPVAGFYVFAVGREAHDVRLRLESDGGFVDVAALHGDEGDRVALSADGRALDVEMHVRPRPSPVAAHDLDGVRFRTRTDATVRLKSATVDGEPVGREVLAPEPLVVPYPAAPRDRGARDLILSFQLVRPPERRPATLDAGSVERLRALGYVE